MNSNRVALTLLAAFLLTTGTAALVKSSPKVTTVDEVLSRLTSKEYLSSLKQAELLIGPNSQAITIRKVGALFEITAITCDAQTGLGYTTAMNLMKSSRQLQMQMSHASACVRYRFFGAGLDAEQVPHVAFALIDQVYGLKKDSQISVKKR